MKAMDCLTWIVDRAFVVGMIIALVLIVLYSMLIVIPLVYGGALISKVGWFFAWGQWPKISAWDRYGDRDL